MATDQLTAIQDKLESALRRLENLEERLRDTERTDPGWQYLVARPHPWRRQLSVKGRNLTVGQLVSTIRANGLSPEQASLDLGLPLRAIEEALAYYAQARELIELEASEERRRLAERGYALEPQHLPR